MAEQVEYRSWLLRIIGWDGMLPASVLAAPYVVESILPNTRWAIEVTAVVLPIVAFFMRLFVGHRHIHENKCSTVFRVVQFGVFFLGIFPLVLIDAALVLVHVMPKGVFATDDYLVFAVLYGIYLSAMIVAMYPGRGKQS